MHAVAGIQDSIHTKETAVCRLMNAVLRNSGIQGSCAGRMCMFSERKTFGLSERWYSRDFLVQKALFKW